jgi:hypothetical protein
VKLRWAAAFVFALTPACALLVGIDENLGVKPRGADSAATPDAEEAGGGGGIDAANLPPPGTEGGPPLAPRPPEGTYTYDASGNEALVATGFTFDPTSYGPTATVVVLWKADASCFSMTIEPRANYTEEMDLCVQGTDIVQSTGTRHQSFSGSIAATSTTTLDCKPGDLWFSTIAQPAQWWNHSCNGTNTDSQTGTSTFLQTGRYTFLELTGGAMKYDAELQVMANGAKGQNGTNSGDWYFDAVDASLTQLHRHVHITYSTNFGPVTYDEQLDLTLRAKPPSKDAGGD